MIHVDRELSYGELRAKVMKAASIKFASHTLEARGFKAGANSIRCTNTELEDDRHVSFRVTFITDYILLTGCVGEQLFRTKKPMSRDWLMSVIHDEEEEDSIEILLQCARMAQRSFFVSDAEAYCAEKIRFSAEDEVKLWKDIQARFRENMFLGATGDEAWRGAVLQFGLPNSEVDILIKPGEEFLWQFHALSTFVELFDLNKWK